MSKIIKVYQISLESYNRLLDAGYIVQIISKPRKGK